jgi:hypothetical protein
MALASLKFAAMSMLICVAFSAQASARDQNVRRERCSQLQQQLDAAMKTHRPFAETEMVTRLRKKAISFCATDKEAQGARTFAKALHLLGLKPLGLSSNSSPTSLIGKGNSNVEISDHRTCTDHGSLARRPDCK